MLIETMWTGQIDPIALNNASTGSVALPAGVRVLRVRAMLLTNTGYTLLWRIGAAGGSALTVATAQFCAPNKANLSINLDPTKSYTLYWGLVNTTSLTNGGTNDYLQVDTEN